LIIIMRGDPIVLVAGLDVYLRNYLAERVVGERLDLCLASEYDWIINRIDRKTYEQDVFAGEAQGENPPKKAPSKKAPQKKAPPKRAPKPKEIAVPKLKAIVLGDNCLPPFEGHGTPRETVSCRKMLRAVRKVDGGIPVYTVSYELKVANAKRLGATNGIYLGGLYTESSTESKLARWILSE
jgi:hypothetical protein